MNTSRWMFVPLVLAGLAASRAEAGSLHCSNPDGRVRFEQRTPDGVAPRAEEVIAKTEYSKWIYDGGEVDDVRAEFGKSKPVSRRSTGTERTEIYVQRVKLSTARSAPGSGNVEFLLCRRVTSIGPPKR